MVQHLTMRYNFSQLQSAIGGTAKATTVKGKDANITVTEGANANGGKEYTVGLGNKLAVGTAHPVTVDGTTGTITGLTNTTWNVNNPQAVNWSCRNGRSVKKLLIRKLTQIRIK